MKNTLALKDQSPAASADLSSQALSVQQVLGQVQLIQQIMEAAMQEGK